MHTVAVLAVDQVVPFDLAIPFEVFTRVRLPDDRAPYRVRICAATPTVDTEAFTFQLHWGLETLAEADTIILPGRASPELPVSAEVIDALLNAAKNGARIASICSGAFVFAATGLLNGYRATTHWNSVAKLAQRYPEIAVDPNVLYVDNGQFLTSAGAAAGLDLCLHMVRRDYGSAVAATAARTNVMPLEREGGQAQFIVHDNLPMPQGSTLEPLLGWLEENIGDDLTVDDIAAHAGMSARTLNRRFREHTGTTPLRWLFRARIRRAQYFLEATSDTIDRIATTVGFGSTTAFRDCFKRVVGLSPSAYRGAFRARDTE
ncbi:GlxA family transcriptional regulator [Nocardia altamirensis]|uniref:GlxA family transcriptional regulator n=1 Tax=Nocardia altamirensis TaxID=472158 RepID=UPI00083FE86A|nr:helix-turn-helix domain-containing protein [Nocardia altamirensis]